MFGNFLEINYEFSALVYSTSEERTALELTEQETFSENQVAYNF